MTLDQIDQQIARWRELQASFGLKLVELDGEPAYQALRNGAFSHGTTAAVAKEIEAPLYLLWTLNAAFDEVLEQARTLRSHMPRPWGMEKWLDELTDLLIGPQISLADGHLNTSYSKIPLANAMTEMVNCYEKVRSFVSRVEERMASKSTRISQLQEEAKTIGKPINLYRLAEIEHEFDRDPLGISFDSFAPLEEEVDRAMTEVARAENVRAALMKSANELRELEQEVVLATNAVNRCLSETGIQVEVPQPQSDDLAEWLETLRTTSKANIRAAEVGLTRWQNEFSSSHRSVTQAKELAESLLSRNEEIRGRFAGAQAKAVARQIRSADVERLRQEISLAMKSRPIPLVNIESILNEFERALQY